MKKRRKLIAYFAAKKNLVYEIEKQYPNFKIINGILASLFALAVALTIWEIDIYGKTIIPVWIPFAIWIIIGVLSTPIFRKLINIYIPHPFRQGSLPLMGHLIYNLVTWGGIILFLFMWTNYKFPQDSSYEKSAKILQSGHLARGRIGSCEEPFATIIYQDEKKELVFPCGVQIGNYQTVWLEIQKGLFGFETIRDQRIKAQSN